MLAYYGYTISPNQMETVEGFLICRNVPIARTGEMEYLESELRSDGSSSKMVTVCRSPDEVFSEAALSSFEGKPVTNTLRNSSHRITASGIPGDTPRTSEKGKGNGRDT